MASGSLSQQVSDSQSILAPNILENYYDQPASSRSPNILDSSQPEVGAQEESETYTHPELSQPHISEPVFEENSNEVGSNNENSNDSLSTINYDAENSNSSVATMAPWSRINPVQTHEEDSSSARPPSSISIQSHENSNYSTGIQSMNEESNSLMSLPETKVRNSEEHCNEPPAKIRKLSHKSDGDLDGETCPICLDLWSNSGDHRLVALKCGHLFGYKCVERWLRAQQAKERSCPTCKSKSHLKDVRFIYARRLVAADMTEITTLQKQIEMLNSDKSRVELELQKSKIAHRATLQQLEVIRNSLNKTQAPKERYNKKSWRFALEKNLEICKDGGCRVLTYNCRTYELYVSQKSTNNLFPGYGIRRVNCVDYKLGQFIHLHPKAIRDMVYSQPRDLLLSVGLDSCAKIVERGIPVSSVQAGVPLWSCTWNSLNSNQFYVGGVGGFIQQYDTRNPSSFVQRLSVPGDVSPVVSLCSTEYGLLSCHLNSCWLWVTSNGQMEPRSLPVDGPFMSMCYDSDLHKVLVSCRRSTNNSERSRLFLCKLGAATSGEVTCELEQTFNGSAFTSLMSRSTLVNASGASWVASHSESESVLYLHGVNDAKTITLPATEPALDLCSIQLNGDTFLTALSETRLRIYKAVSTNLYAL